VAGTELVVSQVCLAFLDTDNPLPAPVLPWCGCDGAARHCRTWCVCMRFWPPWT